MNRIYRGFPAAVLLRIGVTPCCGSPYETAKRQLLYHGLRSFQTSARRGVISIHRYMNQAISGEEDPFGAEDNGSYAQRMACQQRSQQISMEEALKSPWVQRLFHGMLDQNRGMLAQAITLTESTHPRKKVESQALLSMVLAHANEEYEKAGTSALSFRIGRYGKESISS